MLSRLSLLWITIRTSLWFLPGVVTVAAAAGALLLIEVEKSASIPLGDFDNWLWGGGVEGARGVLSAIAGGLITVTGVVFSVTVVALQLASSQFTPRLLRNFTADRTNQAVLAVLIGTFTYSLLVLRVVRAGSETETPFVPRIAVTVSVLLVLVSIAFLIYFIHHASKSIQIAVILDRVTRLTLRHAERLLTPPGEPAEAGARQEIPAEPPVYVMAGETGYLQALDTASLQKLNGDQRLIIRMEPWMGDFILTGRPLAAVWPADAVDEKVIARVRRLFLLGMERTPEQDVEFGIIEISDIAVKALSPAINDPTTALRCIDKLGEILLDLGRRPQVRFVPFNVGSVHFLARAVEFERVVGLAFDQIRHSGTSNPTIGRKLIDILNQLIELLPPDRHPPLNAQREAVIVDSLEKIRSPVERTAFDEMVRREL